MLQRLCPDAPVIMIVQGDACQGDANLPREPAATPAQVARREGACWILSASPMGKLDLIEQAEILEGKHWRTWGNKLQDLSSLG